MRIAPQNLIEEYPFMPLGKETHLTGRDRRSRDAPLSKSTAVVWFGLDTELRAVSALYPRR